MANVKILLDKPNSLDDTYVIFKINHNYKSFKISARLKVNPKDWNPNKRQIRTSDPNHDVKNFNIKTKAQEINRAILHLENINKALNKQNLLDEIKLNTLKARKAESTLIGYLDVWIEKKKLETTANTQKVYISLKNHLLGFEEHKKIVLQFNNIDQDFYDHFTHYLTTKKKLFNNAVGKYIKTFKSFMKWGLDNKKHHNTQYQSFKVLKEEREIFPLSLQEYKAIEELELPPHLDRIRDLFLFECYTGLRYSDTQNLKQENIQGSTLRITTQKTRKKLSIPLSNKAQAILNKYSNNQTSKLEFPKISNQKANDGLKNIGKMAKLEKEVAVIRYRGSKRIEESFKQYEKLSQHCGRQSFITNSLLLKIPSKVVMEIVGHDTFKSFSRYTKFTDDNLKNEIDVWNR